MRLALTFLSLVLSLPIFGQEWQKLNQKTQFLYSNGKYEEAIESANKALVEAEKAYGKTSDAYLASLTNRAYAESALGNYLHALNGFHTAADLSFLQYRLPHINQLESVTELSKAYMNIARYDSAEHFLDVAQYIFTSIPQKNKAHYDSSLWSLTNAYINIVALRASLSHKKGQVVKSVQTLEELIQLIKDTYQNDYERLPHYRTAVSNLSTFYNELYNLQKAKEYAVLYYQLIEKDSNELDLIHAFQNLGSIYRNLENDSANYYWDQAIKVIEAGDYKNTRIHTVTLNNLGEWSLHNEDYETSIQLLQKSLDIQNSKQAINPPLHQTTLYNLAEAYRWSGNYEKADMIYSSLMDDLIDDIKHNFTYLTDNEKIAFYNNQVELIDNYKTFGLEISGVIPLQDGDEPYINREIFGKLYNLQLNTKAIILNASKRMKKNILESGDSTLINVYTLWEERKNRYAQALLQDNFLEKDLATLAQKIEENEKWLTTNSQKFKSGFTFENVTWEDVRNKLKPDEAAVEIIRLLDGLIYGALIVTPETDRPALALIMSTRSKHLEKQFYQQYRNAMTYQLTDTISFSTYWKPIEDKLVEITGSIPNKIFFSNDGIYNQLNVNTLFNGKDYVIDQTDIVFVTNTKEIVGKKQNRKAARTATLFGRPSFSTYDHDQIQFDDLPGTGKEVELINETLVASNWDTKLFMAESATEQNIKLIENPSVLHVASHGYFSPESNDDFARKMITSGIALAGVNDPIKKEDDGLFTAFEVLNLNLEATQLVVLSACETALGTNSGEGVYGLQRALHVAGANNMIMSLWKVDDTATQKLMEQFYKNWTASNDLRLAFREAQFSIRKSYNHPYYWGAFILIGN